MSTIRVVNIQHTDATEPNIVLEADGTTVFASGITISGGTNLTVSGTAEFASGTASAPSITFIDDNNTGIYEPAADTVAITTAATERLRIDSSGNLGIGTTSPGVILDVAGSNPTLRVRATTVNTEVSTLRLTEDNSYVGAYVKYDGSTNLTHIGTHSAADSNTANDNHAITIVRDTRNVGIGTSSPGALLDLGTATPILRFSDTDTTGYHQIQSSNANFIINADPSNATASSSIGFNVDGSERMRIDSSGRLLIGTSVNGYNNARIQIAGSNSSNYLSLLNTTASDTADHGWSVLTFRRTQSGGEESTCAGITGRHDGSGDDQKGKLELGTNDGNDNNGFLVRMEMDSAGYVRLTPQSPGIQFNGDTATTNALDDYEEGTFTPALSYTTPGTSNFSYTAQTGGLYTKIGRFVYCRIEIRLSGFTKGTASGDLQITGLPFSATGGGTFGQFVGNFASFQTPLPTAAGEYPVVIVLLNQSKCQFKVLKNNNNWGQFPDPDGNSQFKIDVQYFV